jgi:hypothetical protein
MGGRSVCRTLSPKRTPFQTGIERWPHLRKVPRRWISHKYPMWLWGHILFKILSLGPILYGTKWLLWRPHKQSPTFYSKCRIDKGLIRRGSKIDYWRSQCKGRTIVAHPLCIQLFIHVYSVRVKELQGRKLGPPSQFCTEVCEERSWGREAEESPLLKSVTRKRLEKTLQAGEDLACSDL